jgi:4-hydroxybenzoate polyprenyltransferase
MQSRGEFMRIQAFDLFRSTHPLPSISVASFAVLFGIGAGLTQGRLVLVGLAVLAQQFSVGLSNDWLDAERDKAVRRQDKPLAQGLVSTSQVRTASLVSAVSAVAFAIGLGLMPALLMLPMLAIGWAYNLGLKFNGFSVVAYIIGFGMLPIFVTLSAKEPEIAPAWVIVVAASFGVAAHFANALPDLLEDKQTGVRALPHILGQRTSALIISISASLASLLLVTQSSKLGIEIAIIGFGSTVALALIASLLALRARPPKLIFYLLILASLVNVLMLMLGA